MLYQCLDLELREEHIRVGSVRPGVVDTPMQDEVRQAPIEVFPNKPRFEQLKKENQLEDPGEVAEFLAWLLSKTEDEEFAEKEWDFRDTSHHSRWKTQ